MDRFSRQGEGELGIVHLPGVLNLTEVSLPCVFQSAEETRLTELKWVIERQKNGSGRICKWHRGSRGEMERFVSHSMASLVQLIQVHALTMNLLYFSCNRGHFPSSSVIARSAPLDTHRSYRSPRYPDGRIDLPAWYCAFQDDYSRSHVIA